ARLYEPLMLSVARACTVGGAIALPGVVRRPSGSMKIEVGEIAAAAMFLRERVVRIVKRVRWGIGAAALLLAVSLVSSASADSNATIDFEGLDEGDIVSQLSS